MRDPRLICDTDSFLFLFFSMVIIAATLYLPQHIAFLTNRAWFYYNGDENIKSAGTSIVGKASSVAIETVKETVVKTVTAAADGRSEL